MRQGTPLPAPHPRTVIPPHVYGGQPAPAWQQGQVEAHPQQGVRGYTRAQTQLPKMDLANPKFQTPADARTYLNQIFWRPVMKNHGVPTTNQDRLPYVKKIYDAMTDLDNILDLTTEKIDAMKFYAWDGVWGTKAAAIEAIAHEIVDICVDLHTRGASGLTLGYQATERTPQDIGFTFAQRIYFMGMLLRHFKFAANMAMTSTFTQQYLARIWSTLLDRVEFVRWWASLSPQDRHQHNDVEPYVDVPANAPTAAEKHEMGRQYALENAQLQADMARSQTRQHEQRQPAQSTSKRPVETVESPEPGPSTKRRAEEPPGEAEQDKAAEDDFAALFGEPEGDSNLNIFGDEEGGEEDGEGQQEE